MKILVHDYSGHPFQVQLSRELSRRGHAVTHSYCAAYTSGKGHLEADPGESLCFEAIGAGEKISKLKFSTRIRQEVQFGLQLARQILRFRPDVVLAANVPIPTLMIAAAAMVVRGIPWVLWHQDVQGIAISSFAGDKLPRGFELLARVVGRGEAWCARRAAAIVAIAEPFLSVHRAWGTQDKVTVIPNWAPLDEIVPVERKNDWAVEHCLDDVKTLLYSGTLGLKHDPALLVQLARGVLDQGQQVELVVVNEGPCVPLLIHHADELQVPLRILPFQPYERLSEVLGSGDVLIVLLEASAGAFSVPSKTLSYLCAGRPVLGLMPPENLAATLVTRAEGLVLPPVPESIPGAVDWVRGVFADQEMSEDLGAASRALAEAEFALSGCADRFESILSAAAGLE